MQMMITAGYDVGAAHLKVARIEDGRVVAVRQIACALWEGLDRLSAALQEARAVTDGASAHAVTMTGELCEIFPSREAGVATLVQVVEAARGPGVRFYMGLKGFGDAEKAIRDWQSVASANFLATVEAVARVKPHTLLIDMGSTTTDIIACDRPQGLTDAERLQTGELVYTGLTRTAVPCVVSRAPLAGVWQGLARDFFASMADVRRVLGSLPEGVDEHATADGRGKSVEESLARLARGFGRDAEMRHLEVWRGTAAHIRETQLQSVIEGASQVISRPGVDVSGGVVAAGIGADEAAEVARRLGMACVRFGDLIQADDACRLWATRCAAAVGVALSLCA
jgi:(4-(4-[2-(gamma-L-glutamylamino)ethyl]phenoxymethyl)furan-2-yl)methanamine synthase